MIESRWTHSVALAIICASVLAGMPPVTHADEPNNSGPYKVISASWLGGPGADALVAAAILPDRTILLGGNSDGLKLPGIESANLGSVAPRNEPSPASPKDKKRSGKQGDGANGFIVHLSTDGQRILGAANFVGVRIKKMMLDGKGLPYILADADNEIEFAGSHGSGRFVAQLSADASKVEAAIFPENEPVDFGVDSNGEVVILSAGKVIRYAADGRSVKWSATFSSHGDNRPGGIAFDAKSGVCAVTGYGMTKTGHEPYKDPYGYGFDRDGKQIWAIWNPDPKRECGTEFGGNGLMADTTGRGVYAGVDGRIYFVLYADGGNTVCSRDPFDPDKKLDPEVMNGVHQSGPGFGFKGASKTSVIFRINPLTGKLEKGTWLSAWITPQRANGLAINAAAADEMGNKFVIGDSASGCPTKNPWYMAPPGGYQGGGYAAIFDQTFKMKQCGFFPGSSITCVAYRSGTLVIAGKAGKENKAKDPTNRAGLETTYPVPTFHAVQKDFGGGEDDGYFVILKAEGE